MNKVIPDRRARNRSKVSGEIELIAGDVRIPARLLDISFAGIQARAAKNAIDAHQIEAVRLQGLPAVGLKVEWAGDEVFGASFTAPDKAGKVIAGFIELFVPPKGA